MRSELESRDGQRMNFVGTIERFGTKRNSFKGYEEKTVLLKHVNFHETGNVATDHIWFTWTKTWNNSGVKVGDKISFEARVSEYRKGYWGYRENRMMENPPSRDYKLNRPTKIKRLKK